MKAKNILLSILILSLIVFLGCKGNIDNVKEAEESNLYIEGVEDVLDEDVEDNVEIVEIIDGKEVIIEETEIVIKKDIIRTEDPDYRNVKWGMSREEVLEREDSLLVIDFLETLNNEDIDEEDLSYEILLYETFLEDSKFDLVYYFDQEGLYASIYDYKHTNQEKEYLKGFEVILNYLNEINDTELVIEDFYQWKNKENISKEESINIMESIENGDLVLYKAWSDENTETTLSLFKSENGILLSVYNSKVKDQEES